MVRRNDALALLRLAWPVALARLGIIAMGITDVIVVGQLAPHELAFQALGWAPTGVALVGGIGLLTGVQVLGARGIGAGAPAQAGGAWRRGIIIGLIAGALFSFVLLAFGAAALRAFGISEALVAGAAPVLAILTLSIPLHLIYTANASFLEAIQKPMASTIAMWLANIVNLVGNLALVPHMGAQGSAISTVLARLFLAAAPALWIWFLGERERFAVRVRAAAPSYGGLLRVGAAAMVSQIAEAGAFSAMTVIAGRLGEAAVATYQILLQQMAFVFMIALGLATATAVLVSEATGRQAPRDASRAGFTGLWLNTAGMIGAAIAIVLFAHPIGHAFTADARIALMVAALTPIAALVLTPDGGQVVAASVLRARGDNWFPTFSHILAYVFAMPALGYWLAEMQGMGVAGLMYAIFWASVLSFGVLLIRVFVLARREATE